MHCRISILNRKTGSRDFIGTKLDFYATEESKRFYAINTDFDNATVFDDFGSAMRFWEIHHNDLCELIDWSTEYYDFDSIYINNEHNQLTKIDYPNKVVVASIFEGRKGYNLIELYDNKGPMMLIPYDKEAMSFLDPDTVIVDYRIQRKRDEFSEKYGKIWRIN